MSDSTAGTPDPGTPATPRLDEAVLEAKQLLDLFDRQWWTATEQKRVARILKALLTAEERERLDNDVAQEMARQRAKFGDHAPHQRWVVIMAEELGEIARAVLHEEVENKPVEMTSREELVQLTGICLRALDDWESQS
jgi:hypothetical protein